MDAIKATGASTLQVLRYGVVPQVIPPFLSFTIYRWDINVRMSTIIGFVGGGGIGYILKPRVDLGEWGEVGTLVLLNRLADGYHLSKDQGKNCLKFRGAIRPNQPTHPDPSVRSLRSLSQDDVLTGLPRPARHHAISAKIRERIV
jgi:hypothetical protein